MLKGDEYVKMYRPSADNNQNESDIKFIVLHCVDESSFYFKRNTWCNNMPVLNEYQQFGSDNI